MKKHITIVFEYETDEELDEIRLACMQDNCRAWSMDHELVRIDLMRQAAADGASKKVMEYIEADGVMKLLHELRSA